MNAAKDAPERNQTKSRSTDSQSIARAVMVLHVVADHPGASLGTIAKQTGLARSTVQRLVNALNAAGLVTKIFGKQGVYLGMELARFGSRVQLSARTLLLPLMEELHAAMPENLDLTCFRDGKVFVIEQLASNEDIRVISYVGKQHPIHCTANGKAHLSMLPEAEALRAIGSQPERMTANTITDPRRLLHQIEAFRATGLYYDEEEYSEGVCAIATALPQIAGMDLTLSVAMPVPRYKRRADEAKAALLGFYAKVQDTFGPSI